MIRRFSVALLSAALRLCPAGAQEWGQAMLAELSYIESPWAALRWALGSSSVLAGRSVASSLSRTTAQTEVLMNRSKALFNVGLASLPVALLFLAQTIWSIYGSPRYAITMLSGRVVEIYQHPRPSTLTSLVACLAVILSAGLLYLGKRSTVRAES